MIVVKHVDSIFGSLLPIRLSTFKLVVVLVVRRCNLLLLEGVIIRRCLKSLYHEKKLLTYTAPRFLLYFHKIESQIITTTRIRMFYF